MKYSEKIDKTKKAKYFVGKKKLKHVKLFESFDVNEGIDESNKETINEGKMKALHFAAEELKDAFAEFLSTKDNVALSDRLHAIEKGLRGDLGIKNPKKGMWWKFFKGDTSTNTVESLRRDLSLPPSHSNYKYAIENMKITQEPENKITVYFL